MEEKWYLKTWFICLMFAFWFFILPGIIGIVLLVMQFRQNKQVRQKYGAIDTLEKRIQHMNEELNQRKHSYELSLFEYQNIITQKSEEYAALTAEKEKEYSKFIQEKNKEIDALRLEAENLLNESIINQYRFSDYDALSSEECRNRLTLLKKRQKDRIKEGLYLDIDSSDGKKRTNDNIKQIIRCFNCECDNILFSLSVKTIDSCRKKILSSFESLNKIFASDGIQLEDSFLEDKLEELNLVYTYELKREQERERQKEIKEQLLEEERVRKEIERQKAKLEKDQAQCNNEIAKLIAYMQATQSDIEKKLYVDKIQQLEEKKKELEIEKESVLAREANARAGYVYIISNIGSFGNNVYKIGMTRRLEPMDRVKELGSASVPFEFDVHAMIFSDDAPALEHALHQKFAKRSVNRVNVRKEFFRVSLDEIEETVRKEYNNTVTFTRIPVAKEYNETLEILKSESAVV